jgi:hypothetical protein
MQELNTSAGHAGGRNTDKPLTTRRRKEATMATSKTKHNTALAQPQRHRLGKNAKPEANGLMPVKAHIYRSIAELNGGFEKVIQELQILGGIGLFRFSRLKIMRELICRMRAEANRDFARAIHDREKINAGYFEA